MPKEEWDTIEEYLLYLRSLAAYMFARGFVDNKLVLEVGCGAGYGANDIARFASSIIAVDISGEAISYAQGKYSKASLIFAQANGNKLPFKASSFDVAISFQVIEHIDKDNGLDYLLEIKRVLKKEGTFILSTPNKKLRLLPFQKPWNPEHKKEYDDKELKKLLSQAFEEVKVYGLCGSDKIQAVESNRVKQTPFKAYIVSPIYRILKLSLPSPILVRLKKIRRNASRRQARSKLTLQETFVASFSLNDFRVDPNCPKNCLDLYGICTKAET